MKLTIVRGDGAVYKDGYSFSDLDLSEIPTNIHALQFNDVSNKGWIEFADEAFGPKPQNEFIESLPSWALTALQKWENKKIIVDTIQAAELASRTAAENPTEE